MAASLLLDDGSSIASSSILALARESHLPDPPHFHHGLLASTSSPRLDLTRKSHLRYATIICYRPLDPLKPGDYERQDDKPDNNVDLEERQTHAVG